MREGRIAGILGDHHRGTQAHDARAGVPGVRRAADRAAPLQAGTDPRHAARLRAFRAWLDGRAGRDRRAPRAGTRAGGFPLPEFRSGRARRKQRRALRLHAGGVFRADVRGLRLPATRGKRRARRGLRLQPGWLSLDPAHAGTPGGRAQPARAGQLPGRDLFRAAGGAVHRERRIARVAIDRAHGRRQPCARRTARFHRARAIDRRGP